MRHRPNHAAVVQDGLDRGVPSGAIARAARLLQAYELMYWEGIGEAACFIPKIIRMQVGGLLF